TQYLEWSSIPVNALAVEPSARRNPPTTSSCQRSIGEALSQRLKCSWRRCRRLGSMTPALTRLRYTADSEGSGWMPFFASPRTSLRAPQNGFERRISMTAISTSTAIWCGQCSGRKERLLKPSSPASSYRASQVCSVCRLTPQSLATSVTVRPSLMTARTALYRCSATLISFIEAECQAATEVGVRQLPKVRKGGAEGDLSPRYRTRTA